MRYFLTFCYDGSCFSGMQIQPNAVTVQEVLEKALSTLLSEEIRITAAGRTDAGVHALKMVAHFDTGKSTENLTYKLNRFLPESIAILDFKKVTQEAHARFDAISREYKYYVYGLKNPFKEKYGVLINNALHVEKMNEAANYLLEYEDFSSFEKAHSDNKTSICNVTFAEWKEENQQLVFTIQANRFLRNMVRAIVGTLIEVGKEKISPKEFKTIIESKDRSKAAASALAKGLFLSDVNYPPNLYI